jgi:hypothetical protein
MDLTPKGLNRNHIPLGEKRPWGKKGPKERRPWENKGPREIKTLGKGGHGGIKALKE